MQVTDAIKSRRSIRKYESKQIPEEHIRLILEAAMLSPSAGNTRPWEFFVIENRQILKTINEFHPYTRMLLQAPAAIVVCARPELQYNKEDGCWPMDCGAAAMSILLQALDLGYGTCWCGVYPYEDLVMQMQAVLSTKAIPVAIIALGVPAEKPAQKGFYDETRVSYLK